MFVDLPEKKQETRISKLVCSAAQQADVQTHKEGLMLWGTDDEIWRGTSYGRLIGASTRRRAKKQNISPLSVFLSALWSSG
jgi:hypothetical protein